MVNVRRATTADRDEWLRMRAALVEAAQNWAEGLGLSEIASDSELHNDIGQRAHAGLGFQEVGRVVQFRKSLVRPV